MYIYVYIIYIPIYIYIYLYNLILKLYFVGNEDGTFCLVTNNFRHSICIRVRIIIL